MQAEKEYPGPTLVQRGNNTSRTDESKFIQASLRNTQLYSGNGLESRRQQM